MKRILTVWLLLMLVLALACSCTLAEDDTMATTWTTNQLNILSSTLIAPERIQTGNLLDSEHRLLRIVARVEEYLASRYPDHAFVLDGLKDAAFTKPSLSIFVTADEAVTFTVSVQTAEEDLSDLTITDGYYAQFKALEAADCLLTLLADAGVPGGKASVLVYGSFGDAYDPALSLADSLSAGLTFGLSGDVFLTGSDTSLPDADALSTALSGHGLHGYITLHFLREMPEGEACAEWVQDYCSDVPSLRVRIRQ